ncbi:MAG: hypothetical protein WBV39_02865 [Rudaea sp.]
MDAFSYLTVLLSIVLGLAITQILQGFRGLILARKHLRGYWPCVLWAILLLFMNVQAWWAIYQLREYVHWTFLAFSIVLAETIPLYLLAALVFPDMDNNGQVDLRTHYYDNHRWFFFMAVALIVTSIGKTYVLYGYFRDHADLYFQTVFAATCAVAAWTRNERYHKFLAALTAIGLPIYIAVLFPLLR